MGGRALILIDTHILIWLDQGDAALGAKPRKHVDKALQDGALAISSISFWEIATACRKGRIEMPQPLGPWRRSLLDSGLRELPLDGEIALTAGEIADLHGDPADRIIVATAMRYGARLMTADRSMLAWPGPLKCIDARS